jgi:uncharacterized protein DUF2087
MRDIAPAIETDHVTLRRMLVDSRRLERTASGSSYRIGFPPKATAFALAVYDLDLKATVAAYREHSTRERALKRARAKGK